MLFTIIDHKTYSTRCALIEVVRQHLAGDPAFTVDDAYDALHLLQTGGAVEDLPYPGRLRDHLAGAGAELDEPARTTKRWSRFEFEREGEAYFAGMDADASDDHINPYNPTTQPRLFEAWGAGNRDE